jgi:type II secretion system protein I
MTRLHTCHSRLASPAARGRRAGITLLEVIISLAIFWLAIIAIANLVNMASRRALVAEMKQQAIFLGESKMGEFMAGVLPMSGQGDTAFDENEAGDPNWHWSADVNQDEVSGLWDVAVTVTREVEGMSPIEVVLTRKLLDPSTRGNTMDPPISSTSTTGTTGSSTSSSSSTTGGM